MRNALELSTHTCPGRGTRQRTADDRGAGRQQREVDPSQRLERQLADGVVLAPERDARPGGPAEANGT